MATAVTDGAGPAKEIDYAGPCARVVSMEHIRSAGAFTDYQLLNIGLASARNLKEGHVAVTSVRAAVAGGMLEVNTKFRATGKRPAPRVEGFKVDGRNVGKFFMQAKVGDNTRVYVPGDQLDTMKVTDGVVYSLICGVPMLDPHVDAEGNVSMSFPRLSKKGAGQAAEYHRIKTVASVDSGEGKQVLWISLNKPVVLGVEGDRTSVMLYNPEIMGPKTNYDRFNTRLNPCVCSLSAAPKCVNDVYAHPYAIVNGSEFFQKYVCEAVRNYEGLAVPAKVYAEVPAHILMARLFSQSYKHDGNECTESPLLLSVETLADFLVLYNCNRLYPNMTDKKRFFEDAADQGVNLENDVSFYRFDFLYLDTESGKLGKTSGIEPFIEPVRSEEEAASILLKHPYCPYLHRWYKRATHVVTGKEVHRFFSKKNDPTFGALCGWITGNTVPVDQATGRVIAKSPVAYIPGSCQDNGLFKEGIRFDTSMSWLANEYTDPEIMQPDIYWGILNAASSGMTERMCALVERMEEARFLIANGSMARTIKYDPKYPLAEDVPIDDPVNFEEIRGETCIKKAGMVRAAMEWNEVGLGKFSPGCFMSEASSNMDVLVYVLANLVVRCAGMGSKSDDGPSLLDNTFIKCWTGSDMLRGLDAHALMGARWNCSVLLSTTICFLLRSCFNTQELFDRFPIVLPRSGFDIGGNTSARMTLAKYILAKWVGNKTVNTYSFPTKPLNDINYGRIKVGLVMVGLMVASPGMTHSQAGVKMGEFSMEQLDQKLTSCVKDLELAASERMKSVQGADEVTMVQRFQNDDDDLTFEQVQQGLEVDSNIDNCFVFKGESFTFVKGKVSRKRKAKKSEDSDEEDSSEEEKDGDDAPRRTSERIAENEVKRAAPRAYDFGDGGNAPGDDRSDANFDPKNAVV